MKHARFVVKSDQVNGGLDGVCSYFFVLNHVSVTLHIYLFFNKDIRN